MKNYLILIAFFIAGIANAQVKDPYMSDTGSSVMTYTPSTSAGEFTYTNAGGTTYDITWSVSGTTLSWESDVTAGSGAVLHLHRLYIYDDTSTDPQIFTDDDFEDGDYSGWGSDYWHSSGSADLGSIQRDISFSFESQVDDSFGGAYDTIFSTIHYREPI